MNAICLDHTGSRSIQTDPPNYMDSIQNPISMNIELGSQTGISAVSGLGRAAANYNKARAQNHESYRRAVRSYEEVMKSLRQNKRVSCYNWTLLIFGIGVMTIILGLSFWIIGNLTGLHPRLNVYHVTAIVSTGFGCVLLLLSSFIYFRWIAKPDWLKIYKSWLPKNNGSMNFPSTAAISQISSTPNIGNIPVFNEYPRGTPPPSYYTIQRQDYMLRNFGPTPSYDEIILNANGYHYNLPNQTNVQ